VDAVAKSGSFDVYQLNNSWAENTLTYNTPTFSLNQFRLIDIPSLVHGWANGSIANNGVALALIGSTGSFSFDSKESLLTGNGPELEIALAGTGQPDPPGPPGPPDRFK
jgi:hypothetical protein